MLILSQILVSSARTARSSATPKSAAPNLVLMRTAELVPTVVALILSKHLPMVVLAAPAALAGTTTPVVLAMVLVLVVMTGTTAPVVGGNAPGFG
jgi:hypothetical protein